MSSLGQVRAVIPPAPPHLVLTEPCPFHSRQSLASQAWFLTSWASVSFSITPERPTSEAQREAAEKRPSSPWEGEKLGFGVRLTGVSSPALPHISCVTLAQSLELSGLSFPQVCSGEDNEGGCDRQVGSRPRKPAGSRRRPLPPPAVSSSRDARHHPPRGDGCSFHCLCI